MINKITLSLLAFILFSFVVKAQVPSKGQVLWLQAGNLQKVDATGALSNWDDASGNKNHATQTLKNFKPLLIKNGMGNQPVVRFDGANDYLNCPSNFPTSSYTIVTLIKVRDFGAYNSIVGGTTSRIYWFGGNSTPQLYHNGSLIYSGKRFFPMNGAILTTVVDDSAKLVSVYYNDTLVLQQKDSIPNIDKGMQIGAFNKGWVFNGDIAEVMVYNRALPTNELDSINKFLNKKFTLKPDSAFSFNQFPQDKQFIARDKFDSGKISISGSVSAVYDSVFAVLYKNDSSATDTIKLPLIYTSGKADFKLSFKVAAGLTKYSVHFYNIKNGKSTLVRTANAIVCGDVYVITGQSNTVYATTLAAYTNDFCLSYGRNNLYLNNHNDTFFGPASGDAWSGDFFTGSWGVKLQQYIKQNYNMPTCVINGGVGGTSIEQNLPDSTNPYNEAYIYGRLAYRAKKSGLDTSVKAVFWYQGESNGITDYYKNFQKLYKAWHVQYPNVKKIYVMQIHTGCGYVHSALRELQRNLKDSFPDVECMSPNNTPGHDGCHYDFYGYNEIAKRFTKLVGKDFYSSVDTLNINAPDVDKAFFSDTSQTKIYVLFKEKNAGLAFTKDTTVLTKKFKMKDAFYVNDTFGGVKAATLKGDTLILDLYKKANNITLTYVPDKYYDGYGLATSYIVYEGPWLINKRKIGAFTFHDIPVYKRSAPNFGVDAFCEDSLLTFMDSSKAQNNNPINQYFWNYGDGLRGSGSPAKHQYKDSGLYNVTLTVNTKKLIPDSITKTIKINPAPNVDFTWKVISGRTISFDPTDKTLNNYLWDFGDGSISTAKSRKYTYSSDSTYLVNLKATSTHGCVGSKTDTVLVKIISNINGLKTVSGFLKINHIPSQQVVILANTSGEIIQELRIYSITGQLIASQKNIADATYSVDVSNLNQGMYIIQCSINGQVVNYKFVR